MYKIGICFYPSACGCPVFSVSYTDETVFPIVYSWLFYCKLMDLMPEFSSGLSVLFDCPVYLFLCQFRICLITVCNVV